jgi:hypothetical protein
MLSHRENRSESLSGSPEKSEDAGDLLVRLYREIGISAVAAALEITAKDLPRRDRAARTAAVLRTGKVA